MPHIEENQPARMAWACPIRRSAPRQRGQRRHQQGGHRVNMQRHRFMTASLLVALLAGTAVAR
jgi:hypothetical protein